MDEYIKREDVKKVVCEGCNERFSEEPCEPPDCEILHAIKSVRAADVVPKARYELAVAERDANVKGFAEDIAKAKSEIAKKICCEIEEEIVAALESNYKAKEEQASKRSPQEDFIILSWIQGKIDVLRGIEAFVEELEDKYTKGGGSDV